jgi:vacuolar-type H+-ATPase subunit E/Vma4
VKEALAPVRAALLAAARADAARTTSEAETAAAETLAAARAAASTIRREAYAQGAASGAATAAMERNRVRRAARAEVLSAQRDGYEQLRAAARRAAGQLAAGPGYPVLRRRLAAAAAEALGPGAVVRDGDGGGVIGELPGRRVDYSLAGFADRAVQAVLGTS